MQSQHAKFKWIGGYVDRNTRDKYYNTEFLSFMCNNVN